MFKAHAGKPVKQVSIIGLIVAGALIIVPIVFTLYLALHVNAVMGLLMFLFVLSVIRQKMWHTTGAGKKKAIL